MSSGRPVIACVVLLVASACASTSSPSTATVPPTAAPGPTGAPTAAPTSTSTTTTSTSTTTTSTTTTSTSTTSTSTTSTSTTSTTPTSTTTSTAPPLPDLERTAAAFDRLTAGAGAVSLSVWRDREPLLGLASGADRSGQPLTTGSPMVVASVGKLVTALTVTRLAQAGALVVDGPVPWAAMGLEPHPDWRDVTVRELLDHTSGMPVARQRWLDDPGSCAVPLASLLERPPTADRGRWAYSNGNYCALGLLVEATTGDRYDVAARRFVWGPAGVDVGPRLTVDGAAAGDGPYARDLARFDRLGGAGSWLAGTDHVAPVLAAVTPADRATLRWPGIFVDQYGWGHTGTVLGAKACAWVLEDGRTAVAATVAGDRPSTGGGVCDEVVPALAADLGVDVDGRPERSPR